jgi:hypothetical protein
LLEEGSAGVLKPGGATADESFDSRNERRVISRLDSEGRMVVMQ